MGRATAVLAAMNGQSFIAMDIGNCRVILRQYLNALDVNVTPQRSQSTADRAIATCEPPGVFRDGEFYVATMAGALDHV